MESDTSRYKIYSYQKFLKMEESDRDRVCKNNMLIVDEVIISEIFII